MKRIGILFGGENSFPGALVEQINARNIDGIQAEFVLTGAVEAGRAPHYAVLIDRISHVVPFYRSFLKHAALHGTVVINSPFWASADDKFFNYALAAKLGVHLPPTFLLPHKQLPEGTTDRTLRNLEYPLDWEAVFAAAGEKGFLKPIHGGGGRDVYHVHSREEFFRAYDQTRDLCMVYQKAVDYTEYFRCYVVGQRRVRIMAYDPRRPHTERYIESSAPALRTLLKRMRLDALKLCRALGYDFNSVEFAIERGVPYAIDFMNPVPDADIHSIGQANFEWIVKEVAELAIAKAKSAPHPPALRGASFLGSESGSVKAAKLKPMAKRKAN
ncbi:MAG TPA: hypothetical protein VGF01_04480 [Terracidiphilus sp.]|jgi:glutathione synthase/RimK-type ligase-like ATP-grasp enzyme